MKLDEINEYFQTNLYEMSNYVSSETGLAPGTRLWVRTEPVGLPHTKYRVKIDHPQNGSAVFSLWGDEAQQVAGLWQVSGKDLKKVLALIKLAGDALRQHIDGNKSSGQLAADLLSIKNQVEVI
jgi:hypothetical protein